MILFIFPYIVDFNAFYQKKGVTVVVFKISDLYNVSFASFSTVVVFKISDLENVNFASFSTRRYNSVL